jgi:outer membrane protein assembly factor BamB
MRRIGQVVAGAALIAVLGGCWPVPGQNANRNGYNSGETQITPASVGDLAVEWTAPGLGRVGSPVASTAGVHVVRQPCLLTTVNATTGAELWSAGTTPFLPSQCGQFVEEVESGDPYVIGDNVYVGAEGRIPSLTACNGFTRGYDAATGSVTSATTGAALEAFRDLDEFPNLVAGTDCEFDDTSQTFVQKGTLGQLGDVPHDVHVSGGFGHTTIGAAGDLFAAGFGLLATQPGDLTTGDGVRAYRPNFHPIPSCGANGSETCPRWAVPTDGQVRGHPVVDGTIETVYAGTSAGTVYAIDGPSGFVSWTAPVGAPVAAAPALAPLAGASSRVLYVPTADGRIVVLEGTTGSQLAELSTGSSSPIQVQPAIAGGLVFAGAADGSIYAFDAAGCGEAPCTPLWSASTGSEITGAPAVSNGQLYVGTADGRLIAYGLA